MQLLDSLQTQIASIPEPLQTSLKDIIQKVKIESHHCIKHSDYKTLDLTEQAVSRFQKLPLDLQNKYLSLQLRSFLYGIYYNGSLKEELTLNEETTNLALNPNLENNSFLGVDIAFYDRLHESNRGGGYWSNDWLVVNEETDGALAVHKTGLTLHIERNIHLQPEHQDANIGSVVAIKMPKNVVQHGFYMAVANAGSHGDGEIVRIYFNLSPDGAIAVMDSLTTQLNALLIPFTFKALYNPSDYGRCDSAVLYFDKHNYHTVHPVLEKVYTEHQSLFGDAVPLFTKLLAPGLALAEEPNSKFTDKESFGLNRCQIIANALLEVWHQDNDTPETRMISILKHFSMHEIELERPYLNPRSEDIYPCLRV
ncbi:MULTISPECIES: T3SS effector HopA1 family protein [unclassified Anabaena]|uniref:T3SS effector HopA1 family protein n=1 Tax=unclassified Anabaena TaxID=2619674 RepID=UPI0039C6B576